MSREGFGQALAQVYQQNPCQVLPAPLWQVLPELEGYETALASDERGINRLEAWNDDTLCIYWRRDNRQPSLLIKRRLEYQQHAIIHQDFLDAPTVAGFSQFTSHYRLIHRAENVAAPELPAGFQFAGVVNSPDEAQAVIAHIAQGEGQALAGVQHWLESPLLTPDLWLWVVDTAADQPAAIGIAELSPERREAALTWIQVLPDYRGRGLGRGLVQELLRRIGDRASFTTASGEVEDREQPGAFLRRCGFTGDDVWWYLSRSQS